MEELTKLFERYCNVMTENNKGAQIGAYSVALVGLSLALRKVRPFSRFKRPSDVPNSFIKNRRQLVGFVDRIEPNGALLMVQHKPLIGFPAKSKFLPVKVSGVSVTGHGISWLQAIVAGNEVQLIPISKEPNYVQCEIFLPQIGTNKKVRNLDVGETLVQIGFGKLDPPSHTHVINASYLNKLRMAENKALKKQMGFKYYIKPTKLILMAVYKNLTVLLEKLLKRQQKSKMLKPNLA